jgi:hypothetical protein
LAKCPLSTHCAHKAKGLLDPIADVQDPELPKLFGLRRASLSTSLRRKLLTRRLVPSQTERMRWPLPLAILLLAGCISQSDRRPEAPPAHVSIPQPLDPDEATRQCHADLRREGVGFRPLPDRVFGGGCTALGAVQLLQIGTPVSNLGAMTCPAARQFARWTREAVQPAARQWLGSTIAKIESMGTYSCRPLNAQTGQKLSEHGRANAVDIGAFVLANGRRITVLDGWSGGDANARNFLRAVHLAGCQRFQVGLGPDANGYHRNHLHFDVGRGPYCR